MKKLFTFVAALALAGAAFALDFSLGVRGNLNMGLAHFGAEDLGNVDILKEQGYDISSSLVVGGGFGVYGRFGFRDFAKMSLGATVEFGLNFDNGKSWKISYRGEESKSTNYANSIDIPLMLTFKVPVSDIVKLDFGLGPNFSIPFGAGSALGDNKSLYKDSFDDVKYDLNFGLVFDADVGFKVGSGYMLIDLRYFFDFTPTTVRAKKYGSQTVAVTRELFYRWGLNLGVGYEFKF